MLEQRLRKMFQLPLLNPPSSLLPKNHQKRKRNLSSHPLKRLQKLKKLPLKLRKPHKFRKLLSRKKRPRKRLPKPKSPKRKLPNRRRPNKRKFRPQLRLSQPK